MRHPSTIVAVLTLAFLAACGSGGASTAAEPASDRTGGGDAEEPGTTTYDYSEDLVSCAPGSTAEPVPAPAPCPTSGSLVAAIHERIRGAYSTIAPSCAASGRILVRVRIGADGVATAAQAVTTELDEATTAVIVDALRAVSYCPSPSGTPTVVNFPLLLENDG